MKQTDSTIDKGWLVSQKIEEARQDWEREFLSRKAEIYDELARASERIEQMALSTVESVEQELPEKIAEIEKEAILRREEAEIYLEKLKTEIDSIPVEPIVNPFFEQVINRSGGQIR